MLGKQHQEMDRPGAWHASEGSGEQGQLENTACKAICGWFPNDPHFKELTILM